MAFPDTIVTFPTKVNTQAVDGSKIAQYQAAMEAGDLTLASQILSTITNYSKKIIDTAYLNSIAQTVNALEKYFLEKYSPAIVVSANQPSVQEQTDFWLQITGTV